MTAHAATQGERVKKWVLVVGPPAIWAVHLTFVFLATVALCPDAETAARVAVLIAGAVCSTAIAALCAVSLAAWVRLRRNHPEAIEGREQDEYLTLLGVFVGFTSLLGVVLLFVPGFTFSPACGMWR
jgi:hypothetical protein